MNDKTTETLEDGLPADAVRFAGDPDPSMIDAFGQPRTRHVRVSYSGAHMVMTPEEAQCFKEESEISGDETPYILTETYLSKREFDDLPEFEGF